MPIANLFTAGGIVTFPLLIFSLVAVALTVERLNFWLRANRHQRQLVRDVLRNYPSNPQVALDKLRQQTNLPIARIFLKALEQEGLSAEEFRLALESASQAELPTLRRFDTIFETIISVAPLLGLLGTILGLIQAFASLNIGEAGGAQTVGVTAGISEALVSTVLGLVVAIVTLLFANMFRGFYRRQLAFIQESGGQLELLYRRVSSQQRS